MNRKIKLVVLGVILCSVASIPIIETIHANANYNLINQNQKQEKPALNGINILVYFADKDGQFQRNVVKITKESYNTFIQQISDISKLDLSLVDLFEEKIELMKEYGIISNDISLSDIFDISNSMTTSLENFSIINAARFESKFAPILLAGMGFGFGIGFRRMPVMKHLAGNIFSTGLIGLGAVLCLDLEDNALYYQYTLTYPYLIHILSGFIGIMLFAFDSLFPPENGPAITFYSNFFALGIAGLAIGFELHLPGK